VLADRVEQDRVAEPRRDLAQDVDALGLEPVEAGERLGVWGHCVGSLPCQRAMSMHRAGATTVGAAGAAIEGEAESQGRRDAVHTSTLRNDRFGSPGLLLGERGPTGTRAWGWPKFDRRLVSFWDQGHVAYPIPR